MKKRLFCFLATLTMLCSSGLSGIPVSATADSLPLALVFYGWHSSTIDQRIIDAHPAILIDNTAGGFWHGNCDPAKFQNYGIKVFSYIHTSYGGVPLAENYGYINAIAAEGSYGVFVDETSTNATTYLTQLCAYAHQKGLKVIINPGTSSINANLYSIADYVMTDEKYEGREPTSVEKSHLQQTIVIGFGNWTAEYAAGLTKTAWDKGFAFSWHEQIEYTALPTWLESYASLLANSQRVLLAIPNLNGDRTYDVLDIILIGNHFGESGPAGWIDEDVNNDGTVDLLDLMLAGNHIGESW